MNGSELESALAALDNMIDERNAAQQMVNVLNSSVHRLTFERDELKIEAGKLKAERDEARQERDAVKGYLEAADDVRIRCVAAIRAERDAARREVCNLLWQKWSVTETQVAEQRGWDCFKEDTNG